MAPNSFKNQEFWVYGSGGFAHSIVDQLENLGFRIIGVIDHLNIGSTFRSSRSEFVILDPTEVRLTGESQIVLGVYNLYGDLKKISATFGDSVRCISPVELYQLFSQNGLDLESYWLSTDFEIFSTFSTEIEKFRDLLCDEDSRALLSSILNYRSSGELRFLPSPRPLTEQYLADDLSTPPLKLRVIDLGACQGENLSAFIESGREFVAGYLLEPDLKNIEVLKIRLAELNLTNLECHALGAWNETTTLSFDASGTTGASLSAAGGQKVKVVALDDFIPMDFVPNLVKMDIEGAELEALNGMTRIIESYLPHLAISVYHKPTDLWALGNMLSERFPNKYKFYLRNYGHQTFDTVLYAVPKD